MKYLQLNSLDKDKINGLKESFNNLPNTNHKDGKYRLRHYSAVELRSTFWNAIREIEVTSLDKREFIQSEEYNKHQGGMARRFKEIDDAVLQSEGMKEIFRAFSSFFGLLDDGQQVDIHQMRVITYDIEFEDATPVAPEGIHQDGFDCIGMVGINRYNINGGELMAYKDKTADPFLTWELQSGEMLMLNDRELWHDATPLERIDKTEQGYGDWFILCATR